jgi:Fe-S-cluster-containing dehydrogenase component
MDRRQLFSWALGAAGAGVAAPVLAATGEPHAGTPASERAADHAACLVDTTLCIGCRACEEACQRANRLPAPEVPYSDRWVLNTPRRPDATRFTVVNGYEGPPSPASRDRDETFAKVQCLHCVDPSCVSACIVAALTKRDDGPVVYNAEICIGCRYCMVACPFEIPAYEYHEPLLPRVRKCTFCTGDDRKGPPKPACAATCPVEAIVFGHRDLLIDLARKRFAKDPGRYVDHLYGEHEVGGTSWMYLVGRPPAEVGLLDLQTEAPPRLTEAIQHGIFKYGALPVAVYSSLAGLMWLTNRNRDGGTK